MNLTHDELCQIAYQFLKARTASKSAFTIALSLSPVPVSSQTRWGFRNFASCLIEAKCSRADLLADGKGAFRQRPELGMGDWRFFIQQTGDYLCRRPSARLRVTACSQWKGSKGSWMATGKLLLGKRRG